jgi:hypothetical protein
MSNARVPTSAQQERFLELVAEGVNPVEAAEQAGGFTASRFRGLAWRDEAFGERYATARQARYRLKRAAEIAEVARRKAERRALKEKVARASARAFADEVASEVRARLETDHDRFGAEEDEHVALGVPGPTPEERERATRIEVEREWEAAIMREQLKNS